jgi:hypothetical protein
LLNFSLIKVCCFFANYNFPSENRRSQKTQLSLYNHVGNKQKNEHNEKI